MTDPYYRMFPREWDDLTSCLSLREEAGLLQLCNAAFIAGGKLIDEAETDRALAARCRVSPRRWQAIKARLFDTGLIEIIDGQLQPGAILGPRGRRPISAEERAAVEAECGGACVYCGTTEGPFEIDHVIPVARGGRHHRRNFALACQPCNRRKGAKTPEEWLQ
ncbi:MULTISPECIES: HNH endonuclease [Hyphobacterium]|uniref:HNH endonuclease n=1 Tax=Hyphobacterium vulgare TaxID=1736751 RepID=A0ABV6ZUC4_9PROT